MMNNYKGKIRRLSIMLSFFKYIAKDKKREKLRRNAIKELLYTEQKYLGHLSVLEKLKEVFQQELTLKPDEQCIKNIFQNICDIKQENEKFYMQIEIKTKYLYRDTIVFDNIDVEGFEKYYQYCRNYNNSQKALEQLFLRLPQLEKSMKNNQILKGMQIADYTITPVQRLPRYILLLKEIKKGTRAKDPDLVNINYLLSEFERLNDENNKSMDKFINRARVEQLSNEYDDKSIYKENKERLFIYEDTASIIKEGKELNVRLYMFTDLIMIGYEDTETRVRKVMKYKLDSSTIVKDQLDTKYFTNLFSIVIQEDVIQFIAQSKEIKEKSLTQIQNIINYMKEKSQVYDVDPITVKVVGTEERFSYSINKYTIYIVEVEIKMVVIKIYLRFSKALELLSIFKKRYPQGKFEDISSSHWLNNHSTKIIEQRMIAIEKMIQQVLTLNQKTPEKLKQNEQSILSLLTLPENFYELPQINSKVDIEIKRQFKSDLKQAKQGVRDILDAYFSARTSQIRISTIQDTNVSLVADSEVQDQNRTVVDVYLIDNRCEKIYISEITRAAEIVKVLAQAIQLTYYLDFRLILEDKYLNRRVIDDDEVIVQLNKINVSGFLNLSINKLEQFWTNSDEEKLLFRKVIYLQPQYEFFEIYQDQVRLEYMVLQFFEEIRELKFLLNRQKLFLYIAFYLIIKQKELRYENIQKFIKSEIFDQIEPKEWEIEVKKFITQINSQLVQLENEKKSKVYLCQYQFLKNIYYEKEATMNIYKLEVHRDLHLAFSKLNIPDIKGNIYIGLSQQRVSLLSLLDKKLIQEIHYEDIDNIRSFPNKLVIQTKTKKPVSGWKFITFQSFEIKMLINFYKELSLNQS